MSNVVLAGQGINEMESYRRREIIEGASLILLWSDGETIDPAALGDVCFAASRGIPYAFSAPSSPAADRFMQKLMMIWGAECLLFGEANPAAALDLASTALSGNPTRERIVIFDTTKLRELLGKCESPIESRLALHLCSQVAPIEDIVSQHHVEPYRLDFAAVGMKLAIECDGHEFHERTKEQARRDKSRDRALTAAGWRVLRFTGSEVWADPARCAREVFNLVARAT